ncbi:MAG TPA: DUF58 domain-containing protein [Marmoricola sp.]
MGSETQLAPWRPTGALTRAALTGPAMALAGLLWAKPALVVLAGPLLVAALVGLLRRPTAPPQVTTTVSLRALPEGSGTAMRTRVEGGGLEQATCVVAPGPLIATRPVAGAVSATGPAGDGPIAVAVEVSPRRWGQVEIGAGLVAVTSSWGGYRWGPVPVTGVQLTALPAPLPFDSRAETPHPMGLVGANRGARDGEGTEFSGIREFQPGDRLRRIHWRTSLRTGQLHAITTTAEQDSEVLLLVDALADVGTSAGVDGGASSLDLSVRAAAALAEHHLRLGNRVGLRVIGGSGQLLRPAAGLRHQRRILETLARVVPGTGSAAGGRLHLGARAGATVLALSPLLSSMLTASLAVLAQRGVPVVAIDTLPERTPLKLSQLSPEALAWRLRLAERQIEVVELARAGIPVVGWRGPGTLDEVMRRLARRSQMPRVGAR